MLMEFKYVLNEINDNIKLTMKTIATNYNS